MEDKTELDTVVALPHSDAINENNPPITIKIKTKIEYANSIYLLVLNDQGQDIAGIAVDYDKGQIHLRAYDEQTLDRNNRLPIDQWQSSTSLTLVEDVRIAAKRSLRCADPKMDQPIEIRTPLRTIRPGESLFDHLDRAKLAAYEGAHTLLDNDNTSIAMRLGFERTVLFHSMQQAAERVRRKSAQ